MLFNDLQKKAVSMVSDNAAAILTAGGVVGTVATAVLTGRAAYKAAEVLETEKQNRIQFVKDNALPAEEIDLPISNIDKAKLVGVQFIPPVLVGTATIASIIMANRMSAQKAAALAAAYGVSQKHLEEYRAKLEQKLTPKKYEEARAEIQQERVDQRPPSEQKIFIIGDGDVTCFDSYSGRYFKASVETIRKAEVAVQREIMASNECSLQIFYDEIGLEATPYSKEVGWSLNHPCNVMIDTVMDNDKTPIIAIEFQELPMWNYDLEIRPPKGY